MNFNDLKKINNYIILSLTRIMQNDDYENELAHFCAVRFINNEAHECLNMYVENSKKTYDENLNKKAYPLVQALIMLYTWIDKDVIILHEGGRKDIVWLSEEINRHLNSQFQNRYVNIEDLAIFQWKLKKTSLKNIAKHFGVYRVNTEMINRDLHNCSLIYEIWMAFKDLY